MAECLNYGCFNRGLVLQGRNRGRYCRQLLCQLRGIQLCHAAALTAQRHDAVNLILTQGDDAQAGGVQRWVQRHDTDAHVIAHQGQQGAILIRLGCDF